MDHLLSNIDKSINSTNRVLNVYQKPVIDATNKWSSYSSGTSFVSSAVVKNSAGTLRHLHGIFVPPTTDGYTFLQIHNTTSLPSNGATPYDSFCLSYGSGEKPFNFDWNLTDIGVYFSTGITVALSSTALTLTISTNTFYIQGLYL